MNRSRQLAAIMFTDIQGYTTLMQENEQKAIQFREKHRSIFNSVTEKYNGKILQYYGDGTLSIFSSAIDAVNCAIEMQLGFRKDPAIPVRIGIHTGDIIFSDEEIIGDGVNVAARIESLALAGSILISDKVYDEVKNQESIQTTLLKSVKLKNVVKIVDVYALSNQGLIVPKAEDLHGKTEADPSLPSQKNVKSKSLKNILIAVLSVLVVSILLFVYQRNDNSPDPSMDTPEKSIAVLPFVNMSNDPQQEYFSDGISEEILNSLAKVEGLKVAGRTSAFFFKGKNEDLRSIGNKLDVKMVLEGSVRKADNQLRITAQLINVEDGFHLWSETYDREMKNIFMVQEDIANHIVEKLKLQIQKSYKSQTNNVEAYDLVLKGSHFLRRDLDEAVKAMEYFQKAVDLDPGYADAHAFVAETYLNFAGYNVLSTADAYARARTAAKKALSINKYEPRAHKVLAYIHLFYDWDWEATSSEYDKALEYGLPAQNEFIIFHDIFLKKAYDRAIQTSKRMLKADPLHPESHWLLGMCYFFAARFKEALVAYNKAIELDADYANAFQWKGMSHGYLGEYENALAALKRSIEISKGGGLAIYDLLAIKILMDQKEQALQEIKTMEFIDPMDAARLYTLLEMPDEAISWIEKGYQKRSVMMVTLRYFWVWDPLRDDPRFKDIYSKMHFPD